MTDQDAPPFSDAMDRERLSGVAIRAFLQLAERWNLSSAQAAALLDVGEDTWKCVKRGARDRPLSAEQLTRVSAMVGVYQGLHLLLGRASADQWPKRANTGPIFGMKSPVDAMIEGGVPTMLETRWYVEAVGAGS